MRLLSYWGKKYLTFQVYVSVFDFVCLKVFYQVDSSLLVFAQSYPGKSKQNYVSCPTPTPKQYYSINRWTLIVKMTGFTIHHPSNIYLVNNFLNIAYAKNQVFFVFKVVLPRFFPIKPFSRKSWELVGSSKSTDQVIF